MPYHLNFNREFSNNKIQFLSESHSLETWELYKIHGEILLETYRLFLADGEKTVKRLLNSNLKIKEIICLEKYLTEEFTELLSRHPEIQNVWIGTPKKMKEIRGYELHQGIMALGYLPEENPRLVPPIFIGNKILEANNWGSLIRSLTAFGVKSLVFDESSCHPYIRRSVRVSMGTIFQMAIFKAENLYKFLETYSKNGHKIFGTGIPKTNKKIITFEEWQPDRNSLILLGNEDKGIEPSLECYIDEYVWIPIQDSVDSLNVAVAGAILATKFKLVETRFQLKTIRK